MGMSSDERLEMFMRARKAAEGARLVCGIGAPSAAQATRLGAEAFEMGADVVLLPPPSYYRYGQSDIRAFYDEVARKIEGPLILSNVPRHATPVEPATAAGLCCEIPNLIGVRDSSGSLEALNRVSLTGCGAARFVRPGSTCFAAALASRLLRRHYFRHRRRPAGVIAGALEAHAAGDSVRFHEFASSVEDAMEQIRKLPILGASS